MSRYVVLKPFSGAREHYDVGDYVDNDTVNGWLHGQKLVGQKFLAPAPDGEAALRRGQRGPRRG